MQDNLARGISICGGEDIHLDRPRIYRSTAAAVYVVSETGDFTTHGARRWSVRDLYAEGCVTGIGQPSYFSQTVILISGRATGSAAFPLTVSDGFVGGRVSGMGARGAGAMSTDSQYNLRNGFDLSFEDITGPNAAAAVVKLGGDGSYGRIWIDGAAGYPFVLMPTLVGDHSFSMLGGVDLEKSGPSVSDAFHGDSSANWNTFHVDLISFPDASVPWQTSNIPLAKFTWRQFTAHAGNIAHP